MKFSLDPLEDAILFDGVTEVCADFQYYLTLFYLKMRDVDNYDEAAARTMMMILFDRVIDNGEEAIARIENRWNNMKREDQENDEKS